MERPKVLAIPHIGTCPMSSYVHEVGCFYESQVSANLVGQIIFYLLYLLSLNLNWMRAVLWTQKQTQLLKRPDEKPSRPSQDTSKQGFEGVVLVWFELLLISTIHASVFCCHCIASNLLLVILQATIGHLAWKFIRCYLKWMAGFGQFMSMVAIIPRSQTVRLDLILV